MDLINEHIEQYITTVISNPDKGFDITFNALEDKLKGELKNVLIYIDRILSSTINCKNDHLKYTHIHIEKLDEKQVQTLAAFLVIKFFFQGLQRDQSNIVNEFFPKEIARIEKSISNNTIPEGVKGHSKAYKKIMLRKKKMEDQKRFYSILQKGTPCASLSPNSIFNILTKDKNYLSELFSIKNYAVAFDDIEEKSSYVILNRKSFEKLKKVKFKTSRFLQQIENVILFNSESRLDLKGFNLSVLKTFNSKAGTNFKNLIIISTSSHKQTINGLKNKIETIESRFFGLSKYPNYQTYIVSSSEINAIQGNYIKNSFSAQFIGQHEIILWEEFKHYLSFYAGLEELASIKMMNIYSLVLNERLKELVLEWIFSKSESQLVTNYTKEVLQEDLTDESKNELRKALSNTFDLIINSNWLDSIKENLTENSLLILPAFISTNDKIKRELSNALGISKNRVKNWFEKFNTQKKDILILDYRDSGRFPFTISPNFHKHNFEGYNSIKGLFLNFFFRSKYEWNQYRYNNELVKLQSHPLKELFLNWSLLEKSISKLKPNYKEVNYKWDEENTYQEKNDVTYFKVFFLGPNRPSTCYGAELFIYTFNRDEPVYRVARVDELLEFDQEIILVQKLEEFYNTINLAERLTNQHTQEKELQLIKSQYPLVDAQSPGMLWKSLLQKKNEEQDDLYTSLSIFFESKNLKLVSKNRFEDTWLNPESKILIPRGKKNFSSLCAFLELPKAYYLIMRRIKNSGKNNERLRTSINNKMFGYLFNDGCFNDSTSIKDTIEQNLNNYRREIDFEELGLEDNEVIIGELVSLVELLADSIELKQLKNIEIIHND